jgi:hypothetical protein
MTLLCQAIQNNKHPSYLSCLDTCRVEMDEPDLVEKKLTHAFNEFF